MNYNPVERPQRTVIVKQKNTQYVYLTQGVKYSVELKQTRPKRILIGKLNDEGLLIPNHNYFDIFGQTVEMEEPGDRSDYVSIGPHLVAHKIAENLGLYDLLIKIFEDDASKILDVATYMIMSENNVMQYFEDYGFSHSLFSEKNFTDSTIGKLFSRLSVSDIDLFIKSWVNMQNTEEIYVAYDSSNMNTVAGELSLAEYGHAKDNPDLPQINLAVGYNQTEKKPIFYEIFPGSMIDNTECEKMVERAKLYGCKRMGFILDRGYFCVKNIKYFENNDYDYILMTKGNANFISNAVLECEGVLKNGYTYYMEDYELYGMTLEKELFGTGKKQYVHVYYNGIEAEKEKIILNNRFNRMDKELEYRKNKIIKRREDVKSYEKYYKLTFDDYGYFKDYERLDEVIRRRLDTTGFFVIITSEKMEADKALETYRDRDAVEKIFRMEKSYLGNDVFRVHSDDHLESKVFVSFIALIIRNEIYKSLKPLYLKNRKEYTVPKVLKEYERLGVTKLSDGKYHVRYKLTAKQKKILKVLNINEKDYIQFADEVKTPLVDD